MGEFCCWFFLPQKKKLRVNERFSSDSTLFFLRRCFTWEHTALLQNSSSSTHSTSLLTLPVFLLDRCTPTHTHMHTVHRTSSAELNLPQLPYRSTGTRISFSLILDATFKCASVFFCLFDICFSCFLFGFLQSHKLLFLNGGTVEWENWGTVMEANEWKCGGDVWFKSRWSLHACMMLSWVMRWITQFSFSLLDLLLLHGHWWFPICIISHLPDFSYKSLNHSFLSLCCPLMSPFSQFEQLRTRLMPITWRGGRKETASCIARKAPRPLCIFLWDLQTKMLSLYSW